MPSRYRGRLVADMHQFAPELSAVHCAGRLIAGGNFFFNFHTQDFRQLLKRVRARVFSENQPYRFAVLSAEHGENWSFDDRINVRYKTTRHLLVMIREWRKRKNLPDARFFVTFASGRKYEVAKCLKSH